VTQKINKLANINLSTATVPTSPKHVLAKADTGATAHYFKPSDAAILDKLHDTDTGPNVRLPNNTIIKATQAGYLRNTTLPATATKTHIFPELKSASLVSIGQLCDVGCEAVFRKQDLNIYNHHRQLVLAGRRNANDGLWDIELPTSPPEPTVNAVLRLDQTKVELAQ
jgi:hypothetical protein